jgi:hypothetical protein
MGTVRAHVVMPQKLAEEIDELVGPRGRSAFLVETAQAEVKRRRLLAFLASDTPAWKDEDHPELADGAYAWVKKMRQASDKRIPDDRSPGDLAR